MKRGVATGLLCALALLACSARPPPRFTPGSLSAERFRMDEGDGLWVLATETVVDRRWEHDRANEAIVAENADELDRAWRRYGLRGARPAVDFRSRLVFFFAESGSCNDGQLTGAALSSAGELVLDIRRSERTCVALGDATPTARVHVASVPRRSFPAGSYVLRASWHRIPFAVRGEGVVAPPPAIAPSVAPPRAADVHPRRARVVSEDVEWAGVWVRDDAVWSRAVPSGGSSRDARLPDLVCDHEDCARPFASTLCALPECPAAGDLLLIERPLRAHGAWPSGEEAFNRLMDEMMRDPLLAAMMGDGEAPRFPHRSPQREDPAGWVSSGFTRRPVLEASVTAEEGRFVRDGASVLGATLRLGFRWSPYTSHDTTWSGRIREGVAGDAWGLDLRLRGLSELHAVGTPRTWVSAGLSIAADNALGDSNDTSLLRVPSLLGLVLPEVGVMMSLDGPGSFYTSHGLPLYVLLGRRAALEARPSFTLRFAGAHAAGADALAAFSLGLMIR